MGNVLAHLKELTPEYADECDGTSRVLLPYMKEMPEGYRHLPEEGYAENWPFKLTPHFNSALGIILQKRQRTTEQHQDFYYVWVQASAFDFREGYTLHRKDGTMVIQVQEASSAVPSMCCERDLRPERPENMEELMREAAQKGRKLVYRHNPKAPKKDRHQLRSYARRDPGFIRLQTYVQGEGSSIWKKDKLLEMTQDALVRLVVSGEFP